MGRHPFGETAMTDAEKCRRYRARRDQKIAERAAAAARAEMRSNDHAGAAPAVATEPAAAAPADALAFYEKLATLIPLPANVRWIARTYPNQTYLHVDDIRDAIDFLTELTAQIPRRAM